MRSGSIVAQLMATKALAARRERAWISRASNSLPEPGRSGDEDAAVGRRDLLNRLADLRHGRRNADQFGLVAGLEFQFLHFAPQARRFERAADDVDQAVGLERLLDEIVGALLDRGDGRFDRAVAGDHHHRQVRLFALERIEHLDAVEPAALQPDVEHHQLRPALPHGAEGAFAVARHTGLETLVVQDAGDQIADVLFVVDDQNLRRHEQSVLAHPLRPFSRTLFCFKGNASVTCAPRPSSSASSKTISPPWSSMILRTMARPRPVPFARVVT